MKRIKLIAKIKRTGTVLFVAVCLLSLAACGKNAGSSDAGDIVSQKKTESGRTPITVLVKYAFMINSFEEAVEKKFPDIDIVQVGNYTGNMGIAEYERRMEHDDLTDIVMTWPMEAGSEYMGERLLDLAGNDFTSRYKLSMLNNISGDGTLYYLPGPSQVRGIVYNKTLFEENGWKVPSDYESFVALCKTIEASGIRSIQLGFQNSEVLDTAFIGYNYGNFYSKPEDSQWIANYNNGVGSFGDHFSPALDVFQQMKDEGIWKPEDLQIDYSLRETMLINRECAMLEDSVLMARMGHDLSPYGDEFGLMPFFNPGEDNDWARLYMVCFIGVNKHLTEPANKEKYDLVMKVMEYISTLEGQDAMIADTGGMFSSLNGTDLPNVPEIKDLIPSLSNGRYAVFNQLTNAEAALREGLAGILTGKKTKEEVIAMVDLQNQVSSAKVLPEEFGMADADFSLLQTGNFVTDSMREWAGTELALFIDNGKDGLYNGKGLSGKIYKGSITSDDLRCILPDLKNNDTGEICKITMTGENLLKTLEYSISVDNVQSGWFYYFSGLEMEYDITAEPGTRIRKIQTADGKEIDPAKVYSIAIMKTTVPEEYIIDQQGTGLTMYDVLSRLIHQKTTISPSNDDRFKFSF